MINSSLDNRLLSCAGYVRAGAVFADIGTDHGYLPLFLLRDGRIDRAVLSDINDGPLRSAIANLSEAGYANRCEFILTDGAAALRGKGITDYAIAGMGGTLIASIIEHAPHLFDKNIRLILQPMTKQASLRSFLAQNGFSILDERYSYSDGKYYVTMMAEYTAEAHDIGTIEAEMGMELPHTHDRAEFLSFFRLKHAALIKAREGKRLGGIDCSDDDRLIHAIEERLKKYTV